MNWPFFSKNNSKKEYYLGLFLKDEEGVVLLISSDNGTIKVEEKEKLVYSNGWENLSNDVDDVLYKLEKKINKQLDKTIFFVYSHFVDEKIGDIKKPYLQKIKELVKNLELTALGYIECFEAVSTYLQEKEEIPLTGILVELDKSDLSIFIYKGGKISHRMNLAKTDNIGDDLARGMAHLKGKFLLPSRIILYNSHDLDSAMDKILTYRWDESYFIQLPRVDILQEEEVIEGLINIFGQQIGSKKHEETALNEDKKEPTETFGFMINQDIEEKNVTLPKETAEIKIKKDSPLKGIVGKIKDIFKNLPKFKAAPVFSGKITMIVGAVIIILGLFLNEYFFHKADIRLFLSSSQISKSGTFNIDYHTATVSANFSQSTATTGQKDIGDPAQGEVTISSFDDNEKTFAKGTVLTGNGLKFILDSDTKVASSSLAADGSAKLPGKVKASVTASAIGPESNLSHGTRFQIDDLSTNTYFAINESDFSGGSKKTVRTVSKADEQNLEKAILDKYKSQNNSTNTTDEAIPSLTETKLSKETFSHEIGEESNDLVLNATAETILTLYDKNNLLDQIMASIKDQIPDGFSINKSEINYSISKATVSDNKVELELNIKAKAIKRIARTNLLEAIIGKDKKSLENILKQQFKVEGYDLKIAEPLPLLNNLLPFFQKNINLTVTSL